MNPIYILTVLTLIIFISELLVKKTALRSLGTALLTIVITAIVANLGLIPSASDSPPLYKGIFTYLAPLSIFFLLLEVNLKHLRLAGIPMLVMFGVGAGGTTLGVITGMYVIKGIGGDWANTLGPQAHILAGMFTGTYIGGSINFNSIAIAYKMTEEGLLYAGAVAVDNILTALWMVATIALPKILHKKFPRELPTASQNEINNISPISPVAERHDESETIHPFDFSLLIMLGFLSMWVAELIQKGIIYLGFYEIPSIIILTTLALLLAQIPRIQQISGKRLLGLYTVYLFLAVIGAYCELAAVVEVGAVALYLILLVSIIAIVHGLVIYGIGGWLKYDWDIISVASQANIGGSSTALALAKSVSKTELMLPAILIGSLGNGIGTYIGFLVSILFGA